MKHQMEAYKHGFVCQYLHLDDCINTHTYSRARLLTGLPLGAVFLDDVVTAGKDWREYDTVLDEEHRRMCQARLHLNQVKCQLRLPKATHLGYVINDPGI